MHAASPLGTSPAQAGIGDVLFDICGNYSSQDAPTFASARNDGGHTERRSVVAACSSARPPPYQPRCCAVCRSRRRSSSRRAAGGRLSISSRRRSVSWSTHSGIESYLQRYLQPPPVAAAGIVIGHVVVALARHVEAGLLQRGDNVVAATQDAALDAACTGSDRYHTLQAAGRCSSCRVQPAACLQGGKPGDRDKGRVIQDEVPVAARIS